ncbi:MAG: anti sigma factor C-terminal domain-containing protein [Vagococcus sp.]|uniref:sigma factor regulator N-terminal domain-containing protein n=1 Tax=Vagococcus sp. TaxID=1933889 RepID=UPI002FC691F6
MVPNFEKSLKRAKMKNILRIILITIITVVIAIPALYWLGNRFVKKQSDQLNEYLIVHNVISEPNIQVDSRVLVNSSATGGEVVSNRSKNISGYVVPWSQIKGTYSLFTYQTDFNELISGEYGSKENQYSYDRQTKQKVADFYHPNINYSYLKEMPNDLKKMNEKEATVTEVALSFDRAKTLKEIEKDIPKEVSMKWMYVASSTKEKNIQGAPGQEIYGFEYSKDSGQDTFEYFLENLEKVNNETDKKDTDAFIKSNGNKKLKEVEILGMMVTGENKDLKKLEKLPYLRASSVGVSAPITPYIKVEK